MMNILLITYQGDMAGSTNSISFLAKGLAERGHNVYVACRQESLLFTLLEGSKAIALPMVFHGRFSIKDLIAVRNMVKQYDIQLINAQSSYDRYTAIFTKWLFAPKVKVVHTRRQRPRNDGKILQRWIYEAGADKIVTISNELKEVFIAKGYKPSRLQVIYNGTPSAHYKMVTDSKVAELRKRYSISEGDTVIGCVSRMKLQTQIIEALKYIPDHIKVLFAGIDVGSLDAHAQKHGIKNKIIYTGQLNREEVLNVYKLLDVNVLASTMDGFGLVLVEAMALGVPVIATNAYGIKDVVKDEENGLLYENADIRGMAAQIMRTLEDANLRERLIANGLHTAYEVFSMEKTIENYERFFEGLIADA